MRKPIRIAMVAGTASVIAAAGTTAAVAVAGSSQQTHKGPSYSTSATVTRTVAGKVSAERARQIARHLVPGAKVTETERDHEHGRAVWEVDLHKQHHEWEVTVDAATGKVLSVHYDTGMEDED